LNAIPHNLSWLELDETGRAIDEQLLDFDIFKIEAIPYYLFDIALFLNTSDFSHDYYAMQNIHLVVYATEYQLIACQLYKLGLDNILRRCVLDQERLEILWECHNGFVGGHVGGKVTTQKVL